MRLVPIFAGTRRYWLMTLIGVGVSIALASVFSVMLLKTLWQSSDFNIWIYALAATAVGAFILSVVESYCAEKLGQNYVKAVRCQLYQGLVGAPSHLAPKRLGVVMSRLITDSNQIKNWASIGIPKLTIHSLSALGLSVFLCVHWHQLGWFAVGLSNLCLLAMCLLTPKMYQIALEIRRDRGRLSGFLGETIIASSSINQFNQLNRETRRLARHSDRLASSSVKQTIYHAAINKFSTLIAQVMTLTVLVFFLWNQTLEKGELAAVTLTLGLLFYSLTQLTVSWRYAITFYAAKARLELALENALPPPTEKSTRLVAHLAHSLSFKQLKLNEEMKPLTQHIEAGSIVKIQDNGLAHLLVECLTKQYTPLSGRITISGRRLEWLSQRSLNKSVITIDRSSNLLRGTVRANLPRSNSLSQLQTLLMHFELPDGILDETLSELGRNLSPSCYAHLLLVKSLLRDPGLLIVSHPDICTNPELVSKLLSWQQEQGFTLFLVGHLSLSQEIPLQNIVLKEKESSSSRQT